MAKVLIKRYIFFHNKQHPSELGSVAIEAFLTHLAVERTLAASTHNQALSALLFLDRDVLKRPLELHIDAIRAKKPKRLPTVLTKEETVKVLDIIDMIDLIDTTDIEQPYTGEIW
jgi:integrase